MNMQKCIPDAYLGHYVSMPGFLSPVRSGHTRPRTGWMAQHRYHLGKFACFTCISICLMLFVFLTAGVRATPLPTVTSRTPDHYGASAKAPSYGQYGHPPDSSPNSAAYTSVPYKHGHSASAAAPRQLDGLMPTAADPVSPSQADDYWLGLRQWHPFSASGRNH